MEVSLSGLQIPTSILLSLLAICLSFIGHRLMKGMDRVAASVEDLNKNMAVMFSRADGLERRVEFLEHK